MRLDLHESVRLWSSYNDRVRQPLVFAIQLDSFSRLLLEPSPVIERLPHRNSLDSRSQALLVHGRAAPFHERRRGPAAAIGAVCGEQLHGPPADDARDLEVLATRLLGSGVERGQAGLQRVAKRIPNGYQVTLDSRGQSYRARVNTIYPT